MYCRNCGKQIEDGKELCADCEATQNTEPLTNNDNVEVIKEVGSNQQKTNYQTNNNSTNNTQTNQSESKSKSKVAAGLFGIFLGAFGVHNFYLGYTGKAIAQLLITILSCGTLAIVSEIWALIEGILILTGDMDKDANGVPLV